jgi:hypothetical protein
MGFKLMEAAQARWRRLNGHELVALVRAGAKFIDGKLPERHDDKEDEQADVNRGVRRLRLSRISSTTLDAMKERDLRSC